MSVNLKVYKLTQMSGAYSVRVPSTNIINREGWMISKKISICSSFPYIRSYTNSVCISTVMFLN